MRRDDDLIRQLMLELEQADRVFLGDHPVEEFTVEQVKYHLALIIKAGLAEGQVGYSVGNRDPTIPQTVFAQRLTPAGHDFISNLRDDTVWNQVKQRTAKAGGSLSLELMSQVAGSILKQTLGLT